MAKLSMQAINFPGIFGGLKLLGAVELGYVCNGVGMSDEKNQ